VLAFKALELNNFANPALERRSPRRNHAVLCAEFRGQLFHGLFPPRGEYSGARWYPA
jgi:hypothetical protein